MNEAIHPLFTDFLMNKKENHKKTQNLYPSEGMKDYLVNKNTTVEEKQLMFILRSRTYPVKNNFKNKHQDLLCSLCKHGEEIVNHEDLKDSLVKGEMSYEDLFGSSVRQTRAIQIWKIVDKIWMKKVKEIEKEIEKDD